MARQFGHTWWGKAWLDALEERGLDDPSRLPRGRTYARQGRVVQPELSPGQLRAHVFGTDEYISSLNVRLLTDDEWNTALDIIMAKAANAAALLSGELPHALADLLLPGAGDLSPDCTCPDWAELCKHAAALCYVTADLFDDDPFALLALRGRDRQVVLTEVRERRSVALGASHTESTGLPRGADPGTSAGAAYRRTPKVFERSATLPRQPAPQRPLASAPPIDAGIDPDELAELIADASRRAWHMLADGADSALQLSTGADVVRRSVHGDLDRIATATKLDANELAVASIAWKVGGLAGFRASRGRWDASAEQLAPGVAALGSTARVRANLVIHDGVQLRLDEDGTWWRFDADDQLGWVLTSTGATDPDDLF